MSWEIHGDLASVLLAGGGAVIMELLHPSVMAGVYTQSAYRTEPFRRARATLGYVLRTTFGTTRSATRLVEGRPLVSRRERREAWLALHASMGLMPRWARRLSGTEQPAHVDRLLFATSDRIKARLVRHAYPVLPCKQLALARCS